MIHNYRPAALLLALLATLWAQAALACDHPYYPIVEGATWQYTANGSDYTRTITNVQANRFTETTTFDEITNEITWTCDANGLQMLEYGMNEAGMSFETVNVTGVTFPPAEAWTVGTSWENAFDVTGRMSQEGMEMEMTGNITNTHHIVGQETVTVQAGTFDAFKVETTSTMNMTTKVMDMSMPMNVDFTTTSWYAEGIGMIKSQVGGMVGAGDHVTELVTFTLP